MFLHALRGLLIAFKRERNLKLHLVATAAVFSLAYFFGVKPWAWAVLALTCALVIAAELVNTAIERLCDKINPGFDKDIKDIKDISSSAVLVCAVFAVVIGIIITFGGR